MRSTKYNAEVLAPIVKKARSLAEVLRALGLHATGGNYRHISARIRLAGLDTSHFRGHGWARGESRATDPSLARAATKLELPNDVVFAENGPIVNGPRLTRRLLALGWDYRCAWCGIASWRDRDLVLHLDHINGVSNDNRLENLRFLCPNCHSQPTPTATARAKAPGHATDGGAASVAEW